MTTEYTVEIQTSPDGIIWQALAPAKSITTDATAEEVARDVAANQSGTNWRVCVWGWEPAPDTGTEPTYTLDGSQP